MELSARIVSFFNPSLILLGGSVVMSGNLLLPAIRQAIYRSLSPFATRDLRISQSPLGNEAGLRGAGFMVVDQLFSRERLGRWILTGTPAGRPELAADVLAAETHRLKALR